MELWLMKLEDFEVWLYQHTFSQCYRILEWIKHLSRTYLDTFCYIRLNITEYSNFLFNHCEVLAQSLLFSQPDKPIWYYLRILHAFLQNSFYRTNPGVCLFFEKLYINYEGKSDILCIFFLALNVTDKSGCCMNIP